MTRYSRTMRDILMEIRGLLDENAFKKLQFVAKDLAKLAAKDKKGMDYKDYMKAAAMMKTGKVKELKKFVNDLDTAPREVIIMRVAREMGNATAERIFNVRINEATGFPPTFPDIPCPECGKKECTCIVKEAFASRRPGNQMSDLYKLYNLAMKTMPGSPKQKEIEKKITALRKELKLDEKLGKDADAGDYIDDFKKSDAPQFKGKSDKKKKDMAIAAYLDAKDKKEEVELDEAKYDLYHKDFSSAMQHAYAMAKKLHGITIDPKEIDDKVATGPKKPSKGKTNSYRLKGKGGAIQVQVANLDNKKFELNMYKEEVELDEDADKSLKKKADASGISLSILKKVFDRGVAAWKGGHRPGTTPVQWAHARVNSFISGGKTRTTGDADLWKQHKGKSEEVKVDEKFMSRRPSSKEVKMAIGIANDPRYKGGNMTGAVKAIEKIRDGLSKYPEVEAALRKANENLDEGMKMNDPKLLRVFDKLKKGSTVKIKHDSSIEKGKDFIEYIVKSKNMVRKGTVEKITMARKDSPTSAKRYLYKRDGKVTMAFGDMAVSPVDIKEELDEGMKYTHVAVDKKGLVIGFASDEKDAKDMARRNDGKVVKLKKPMSDKKGDMMVNRPFKEEDEKKMDKPDSAKAVDQARDDKKKTRIAQLQLQIAKATETINKLNTQEKPDA